MTFSREEFECHIVGVRQIMADNKLDATVLVSADTKQLVSQRFVAADDGSEVSIRVR